MGAEPLAIGPMPAADGQGAPGANEAVAYELTEAAAAQAFVEKYGDQLRHVPATGAWYRFVWFAHGWSRQDLKEAPELVREFLREFAAGKATMQRRSAVTGVLDLAGGIPPIPMKPDAFDKNPDLLGTPSGVVDLRTGEIRKGRREDFISKRTLVGPAAGEGDPVQWLQFMLEACGGDESLLMFLQRWAGYCATGHVREHKFLWLRGVGGAGTSTFVNTLLKVLRDYGAALPPGVLQEATGERHLAELSPLEGARLAWSPEADEGKRWNEPLILIITSGDPLVIRLMRGNPYPIQLSAKLMITSNGFPGFRGVRGGIRRRIMLCEFKSPPKAVDRWLGDKLMDERAEILRWVIEGAVQWYQQGLCPPESVLKASESYLEDEDTFGIWLGECCDLDPAAHARAGDLFDSWRAWCQTRNEHPGSERSFSHQLQGRGFTKHKHLPGLHGVRGYSGLCLRSGSVGGGL